MSDTSSTESVHAPVTREHMGLALSILQLDAAVAAQRVAEFEAQIRAEGARAEREATALLILAVHAEMLKQGDPYSMESAEVLTNLRLTIERGEHRK